MNDSAKRPPLFQIHLSTAVALMFASGGLMWANTRPVKVIVRAETNYELVEETSEVIPGDPMYERRGWPLWATIQLVGAAVGPSRDEVRYSIPCPVRCDYYRAATDGVIALILLAWAYAVFEWCICRSTTAKKA